MAPFQRTFVEYVVIVVCSVVLVHNQERIARVALELIHVFSMALNLVIVRVAGSFSLIANSSESLWNWRSGPMRASLTPLIVRSVRACAKILTAISSGMSRILRIATGTRLAVPLRVLPWAPLVACETKKGR